MAVRARRVCPSRAGRFVATVIGLSAALAWTVAVPSAASASLRVVNGDFSDLAGLADTGANGWHSGVPRGWQATASDTRYAVNAAAGDSSPVCNVSVLGFLRQDVGTLERPADVTVRFDVTEPWGPCAVLGVAILDGAGNPLAKRTFQSYAGLALTAPRVPAGTRIVVQFWALHGTTPALDNVAVATGPPGSQPPLDPPRPPVTPGVMGALDAAFRDPPNAFRIIQYSGHDGAVLPIERMRQAGIGGVMLFLDRRNYLRNEDAWSNLRTTIGLARQAGMQVWVADDNGYPSGMAGGLVVASDPAFEMRGLVSVVRRGTGRGTAQIALPDGAERFVSAMLCPEADGQADLSKAIAAPVAPDHVEAQTPDGPWALQAFAVKPIRDAGTQAMTTKESFNTSGLYPNLLDGPAMDRYGELTHGEYLDRLGPLGRQIDLFYSNEPNLMTTWHIGGRRPNGEAYVPWHPELPVWFEKDHGYDLQPLLPHLFHGASDEAALVRRHFYQTIGNRLAANFTGRLARWARAHGVRTGGHLLLEERMDVHVIAYGNFLQVLKQQNVPGCDIAMPDPGDYWDYWMPRLIRSAAELRGSEVVSALFDPLIGRRVPKIQPKPEEMMRVVAMAHLMGINQISSYVWWDRYEPDVYRRFNEQVGRLSVMLRGARTVTTTAVYYPIETFQSRYVPSAKSWTDAGADCPGVMEAMATQAKIARGLFETGRDFGWVDAEAIAGAAIEGPHLVIAGRRHATVIMPHVDLLPLGVMRKLDAFRRAGGRVLWGGSLPRLGDAPSEHEAVRALTAGTVPIKAEDVPSLVGPVVPPGFRLKVEEVAQGVFFGRFVRDGRRLTLIVNTNREPARPRLAVEGGPSPVWIYSPADGSIARMATPATVTVPACAGLIVVEPPEDR